MSQIFKTATIFIKPFTEGNDVIGSKLCQFLIEKGITPIIVHSPKGYFKDAPAIEDIETVDAYEVAEENNLVIVLGGDGTFLSAVRYIHGKSCPITGVNFGNLGFLTETEIEYVTDHIEDILKDNIIKEERPYFLVSVERKGKVFIKQRPIMNDAIIQRNSDEKMVSFSVQADGKQVTNSTRGDGLIIATPTGSTAYNLSANGPIVYPTLDALIISPICPSKLSFKPIVIPPVNLRITLETDKGHLSLDGRRNMVLEQGDIVTISKSPYTLRMLHNNKRNFFDLIRTKLGWDFK